MSDRFIHHRPRPGQLTVSGTSDVARGHITNIYQGLVVDVILDHLHKDYSPVDGYNVGAIKVRIFEVSQILDDSKLDWAFPIDNSISEYPLIGESVELHKLSTKFLYTRKVPFAHRIQENAALNLNSELRDRGRIGAPMQVEQTLDDHIFGNYFRPDSRVRQLKHFEGDTIFQGRMGTSIRFGSRKMNPSRSNTGLAPNIIMRTGQAKDKHLTEASFKTAFGLIMEDVNDDASSLWMVSDQNVPFRPITRDAGSYYRSISNPVYVFGGASITANSDRIVLDSKKSHIMMFSNDEIYMNSFKRTSIDADESIFLTANIDINNMSSRNINSVADEDFTIRAGDDILLLARDKVSISSKKIHIGGIQNDAEPIVGGTSLAIFLARLINVLMGNGISPPQLPYQTTGSPVPLSIPPVPIPGIATFSHVITAVGPGQLNPAIVAGLNLLYLDLILPNLGQRIPIAGGGAVFNSYDNFVALSNQNPDLGIELNEFETGTRIETENSEWNLSDEYYEVI
jgi:hypothetical protein